MPNIWIISFWNVNLQPSTRVPFESWCLRIKEKLKIEIIFNLKVNTSNCYALLPVWWHAMIPSCKKKAFNIVQNNDGFTYECIQLLESEYGITR